MERALPPNTGSMAAILGLDLEKLEILIKSCESEGTITVANYNCPGQIVITREVSAIEKSLIEAKDLGAKKAVKLNVSGPFHSRMLEGAGLELREELLKHDINEAKKETISNVDALVLEDKEEIIEKLVKQVSSPVLFQQSIELLIEKGVNTFIEVGPNKSLSAFVKRTAKALKRKDIKTFNIETVDSFRETIDSLKGEIK